MNRREFIGTAAAVPAAAVLPAMVSKKEPKIEYCSCGSGNAGVYERMTLPGMGRSILPSYICPDCKKHRHFMPKYGSIPGWQENSIKVDGKIKWKGKKFPIIRFNDDKSDIVNLDEIFEGVELPKGQTQSCISYGWLNREDFIFVWDACMDAKVCWGLVGISRNPCNNIKLAGINRTMVESIGISRCPESIIEEANQHNFVRWKDGRKPV